MKTRNPSDPPPAAVLPPGRLERLVQSVTKAYRKAHITAEELRDSELAGVQVTDVDFLERTIRVRGGKGGKDRIVLFTQDLG